MSNESLTKVIVGKTEHMVSTKPLTLICHDGAVGNIEIPSVLTLTPRDTVYHAVRVQKLHVEAIKWFNTIFYGDKYESMHIKDGAPAKEMLDIGEPAAHVLGMVDLMLKMILQKKVSVFMKLPETYLHPRQAVALGDFFAYLSKACTEMNKEGGDSADTETRPEK